MQPLTSEAQAKLSSSPMRSIGGMLKHIRYFKECNFAFNQYFFLLFDKHSYDETTGVMDPGFPRSTEDDFPGIDDEVDAAAYQYGIVKPHISNSYLHLQLWCFYSTFPILLLQESCISTTNTCSSSTVTLTGRSSACRGPTPFSTADETVCPKYVDGEVRHM